MFLKYYKIVFANWGMWHIGRLGEKYVDPIPLHYDNTSAISMSKNPFLYEKTKHIPIKYHF